MTSTKHPIRVAVTGAAGRVAYSLLFRIASGAMFGPNQPVTLNMIETPERQEVLKGVVMELEDCAFPLLRKMNPTSDIKEGFSGAHWIFLIGALHLEEKMKKADWIKSNAKIFYDQGKIIEDEGAFNVRIITVGNPCNTNCWAARQGGIDIPDNRWFALTSLDAERAANQIAKKAGVHPSRVKNMAVWGNHTSIYPDFYNAKIDGKDVVDFVNDEKWLQKEFIRSVQMRRTDILKLRKGPPSASAADSLVNMVQFIGNYNGMRDQWFSVATPSNGSYGVDEGLVSSFPIQRVYDEWEIVPNLRFNDFSRERLQETIEDLREERDFAMKALEEGSKKKKSKLVAA